jgi:DNA invertase Pin-like site-specific DNA recombinase
MSPRCEIPTRPTKAAIYARYSSDLQNERSIDDQLRLCTERAIREGWTIYRCYSDHAISGTSMERSGLRDMLADARAARFTSSSVRATLSVHGS